jgi:hypothetical protein
VLDSQEVRLTEINSKMKQLGMPNMCKVDENRGEIFTRFLHEAWQNGIYKGNVNVSNFFT